MEKILAATSDFLGEILLKDGAISEVQLAQALALQGRNGGQLGNVLIGEGSLNYYTLYRALAEHQQLPFVDLLKEPPENGLLHQAEANVYLQLQAVPWRRENGKIILAVCDPSAEVMAWIKQRFGNHTGLVITSPLDIRRTVETLFGKALETSSRLALWQQRPESSARIMMFPRQWQIFYGCMFIVLTMAACAPDFSLNAFIIACHVIFAVTMIFKYWVFAHGTPATAYTPNWKMRLATLDERRLPIYTVLVPMMREAETLPKLIAAMERLDYPAAKLDIKLVLEADDKETLNAARALKPDWYFDIVLVPPSTLRTKPRACNYALRFARGEFITVFDADDKPDRLQLKKAVYMFRSTPKDVVCLQARLNYYNANDNWLTRFFSLEYTMLFYFMLYGLERLNIPLPLGGTSNHISVARLKALGEWDPYNVTEDADLGTRLAAQGFRTVMLDSYTMEEAPNSFWPWLRQRSRWIKGYMQTWLVHMRNPAELYRTLGPKSFIGFQCFIGFSSLSFLVAPLIWSLWFLWLAAPAVYLRIISLPEWLGWLGAANFTFYLLSHWYFALNSACFYRKNLAAIYASALFYPSYLILHSLASYKALWQLIVKPHFWEKTTHGLAKHSDASGGEEELLQNRQIQVDRVAAFKVKERLI